MKDGWLEPLARTPLWFRKNELLPPKGYPPETDSPEAGLRNANLRVASGGGEADRGPVTQVGLEIQFVI